MSPRKRAARLLHGEELRAALLVWLDRHRGQPTVLDVFCGESGAGEGYRRAGFAVLGIDNDPARLAANPGDTILADALEVLALLDVLARFTLLHTSPPCQGYSRGTAALPDRLERYDRLIAITRELLIDTGRPYVIENVNDAAPELRSPLMLCGRMFGLGATDDDGTPLVLDRHRLFECSTFVLAPPHPPHDPRVQVAGVYGGARRDKIEARKVRKGGYVPPSLEVLRALIGAPWMTETGCFLSIPPTYTEWLGAALLDALPADTTT